MDAMDKLRAFGVGEFVSLPQIVVCGDQSSGKSSVLEVSKHGNNPARIENLLTLLQAITELKFPRQETLCTKFATQIVLRRSQISTVSVSIISGGSDSRQSEDATEKPSGFKHTLGSFNDLPDIINKAGEAMGLNPDSTTYFSKDVLSIEISGPSQPHLTVVDLPGLIHTASATQDSSDVQLVSDLVESYMKNPRTIILAVVSAMNDFQNQIVLSRAKIVDPEGRRTLGIITKPDTIPIGSEKEDAYIGLAKNMNISFGLGWHVLRNRKYEERSDTFLERNRVEDLFFQFGAWAKLPEDSVGIVPLRSRLSQLLYEHIKGELPSVYKEILSGVIDCEKKLAIIGKKRDTVSEQRIFLSKLGQEYLRLCKAAVDGNYDEVFFGDGDHCTYPTRLRAVVQNQNTAFAEDIHERGQTYKIDPKFGTNEMDERDRNPNGKDGSLNLSHSDAIDRWIKPLLQNSRGRELSGSFDPMLVGSLFRMQSKPWKTIAENHIQRVSASCRQFLESLIPHISNDNQQVTSAIFRYCLNKSMGDRIAAAKKELGELMQDLLGHPITYNHYYTDNIQKSQKSDLKKGFESLASNDPTLASFYKNPNQQHNIKFAQITNLVDAQIDVEADMETYACEDLLRRMQSYYKVP